MQSRRCGRSRKSEVEYQLRRFALYPSTFSDFTHQDPMRISIRDPLFTRLLNAHAARFRLRARWGEAPPTVALPGQPGRVQDHHCPPVPQNTAGPTRYRAGRSLMTCASVKLTRASSERSGGCGRHVPPQTGVADAFVRAAQSASRVVRRQGTPEMGAS